MAAKQEGAGSTDRSGWVEHTAATLRRAGHPSTGPRMAVVELLGRQECVVSARDIADALRAEGRDVGIATVYRALERLDALGLVQRLDVSKGSARYEPADPSGRHHHHAVCDSCGRVTPFDDRQLERALDQLARRLDFRVEGHDVVLRGDCEDCVSGTS